MQIKLYASPILFLLLIFFSIGITQTDMNKQGEPTKDIDIEFQVKWDGRIISGISKVSGLKRKTEVITHRNGQDPSLQRRSAGITTYEPIVIHRPRSADREFEQWANKIWNLGSGLGSEVSLRDYRKDIRIELCTKSGRVLLAFNVYRCWPSEYQALSNLDADSDSLAIEKLVLQHEGWERDYSIE